jgi:hypothetical protein
VKFLLAFFLTAAFALAGPRGSLDPRTAEFCVRVHNGSGSAPTPLGRAQVGAFVQNSVTISLWSNMVCWPLRSSQNAGTGTTAYSLGGLGVYDGTLVNGPTWGADGITTDQTTLINTGVDLGISGTAARTVLICTSFASQVNGRVSAGWGGSTNSAAWLLGTNASNGNRQVNFWTSPIRQFTASAISNGVFSFWGASGSGGDASGVSGFADGIALTGSGTGEFSTVGNFSIGRNVTGSASGQSQTVAFALVANFAMSSIQMMQINNLYKSTLGQGLGLP